MTWFIIWFIVIWIALIIVALVLFHEGKARRDHNHRYFD